jgi:hypothetical protein
VRGSEQTLDPRDPGQPKEFQPYVLEDNDGIENAGRELSQFVDPHKLLDRNAGRPRRPLVIFAFDEAHILTDNPPVANRATTWNLFSELRRVLRQSSDHPIFWLFLSTAGRFNLFSPEISSDPSRRIQNSILSTLDPITEISFDDLAYDAPEYEIMLERVVLMDWMCHLGRPLYALFGYHFSEQLTSHLEQVCVHLRCRGETIQQRYREYGLREDEVAGWSDYAWEQSVGFSSLPFCAFRARVQHGRNSWRRSPYSSRTAHAVVSRSDRW